MLTTSVIIPVYNGHDTLQSCLQSLQNQIHPPDEIIVVDDGSTDDSTAIAIQFGVTVLSQANAGPAAARNLGAQVARGDILLFTDADCAPALNWVEQMLAPFSDPTVVGVKGVYRTDQQEWVARFVQQEYEDRYDRLARQLCIDFVDTYSAGYRRKLFLAAGGFDTSFPTASAEDVEFSFRLAEQGHRLVYAPQAIVYHQHKSTISEYARRKYRLSYWRALAVHRHPGKLLQDSHTPQTLKIQLILAALGAALLLAGSIVGSRLAVTMGGLAWLTLLLSGMSFYIKILRRDSPILIIAPLLLFVRAWALGWGFLLGNLRFILPQSFKFYKDYKL